MRFSVYSLVYCALSILFFHPSNFANNFMEDAVRLNSEMLEIENELVCSTAFIEKLKNAVEPVNDKKEFTVSKYWLVKQPLMCRYMFDALCTAHPEISTCGQLEHSGAYGGYYLARHMLPIVSMLRAGLGHATGEEKQRIIRWSLALGDILLLLKARPDGCEDVPRLRTWCTVYDNNQLISSVTHELQIAFFVSEVLSLWMTFADDLEIKTHPNILWLIAYYTDVLAWEHVFFKGLGITNAQTYYHLPVQSIFGRIKVLLEHKDKLATQAGSTPYILFSVEGWLVGIASNLLAIDELNKSKNIFRRSYPKKHLSNVKDIVKKGIELLESRVESTEVIGFSGKKKKGLVVDAKLWDQQDFRLYSGDEYSSRPITVTKLEKKDSKSPAIVKVLSQRPVKRATSTSLDVGHLRRMVYLLETLRRNKIILGRDMAPNDDMYTQLANQFVYGVYVHEQHRLKQDRQDVPRFTNYLSGMNGWYRVTPDNLCLPGVPPYGFSTQLALADNFVLYQYNSDLLRIWQEMDEAINAGDQTQIKAPAEGVTKPCDTGQKIWHWTYRQRLFDMSGRPNEYGLSYLSMKQWLKYAK